VNEDVGGNQIDEVDPGGVVGVGFGMGFALNEDVSLSVGYSHSFVTKTSEEINGKKEKGDDFQIGQLNLGFNYRASDDFSFNSNLQLGMTDDAPDVVFKVSTPFSFGIY